MVKTKNLCKEIVFSALRPEERSLLHGWLNRPHLRRFFQKQPVTLAEVEAEYGPAVRGEEPTHCHLARRDGKPFGYLQCYALRDWPDWAALIESSDGIGVDLAIFEPHMLGRGFGRAMLRAYLDSVAFPLYPAERKCFIAHELDNHAAVACSSAVGFRYLRDFREGDHVNALFVLERDIWDDRSG